MGKRDIVQSVGVELSSDHTTLMELAQVTFFFFLRLYLFFITLLLFVIAYVVLLHELFCLQCRIMMAILVSNLRENS
jgi:hypothetical protein